MATAITEHSPHGFLAVRVPVSGFLGTNGPVALLVSALGAGGPCTFGDAIAAVLAHPPTTHPNTANPTQRQCLNTTATSFDPTTSHPTTTTGTLLHHAPTRRADPSPEWVSARGSDHPRHP